MKKVNVPKILANIVLCIIVLNCNLIVSEASNINFRNIRNEDGLSQSTVETIIQDKKGYIWIGTNDGLNKYNGYDFEIYRHSNKRENSIANNYIVDLQEDHDGNIWVGTANGLSKINTNNNEITNYFSHKDNGNLSHNNIGDILITSDNNVIIGTSDGVNIYDKENDNFVRILNDENDLTNQCIRTLEQDVNGNIWIATKIGLNKIDINKKHVQKFYSQEEEDTLSENNLYGLYYDDDGYIWVGTYKKGLNKIDISNNTVTRYKHNPNDKDSISGDYIRDIFKDSGGNIWIATENGLSKFNESNEKFISYNSQIYDKNSLIGDDVFDIIEDKSGLIWVGTYSGISVFDPNTNIKHYKSNPLDENSLSENIVHGVYEDEDGFVWVGTNSQGVNIINKKTEEIFHLNRVITEYALSDNRINDITGDGNTIYIATNDGVNKIDKEKGIITVYNKEDGVCEDNIRSLLLDSRGLLWIGTSDGVSILNTKNEKIFDITDKLKENNIDKLYARVIYEDKDGIYWIGCFVDEGLIKLDPNEKTITKYKNKENDKRTISSDTVRSIAEDKNGDLWIGTSYGLNKLNKKSESFTRYTTQDGLANNIVYGILVDDENNIWSSTNKGISKLDLKMKEFQNFGITEGLQGNEFNGSASYRNNKGEFLFGGINGLNIFHPSNLNKSGYIPNVEFDRFKVNGNYYNTINQMKFKYNQNFINIKVFLPDYSNSENVQYYHMLEGANEKWSEVDSNDINYSNLSPGKYTLKIKAKSHNGMETNVNSVSFTIKPPFYKSKVALLIYLIIIILIIYSYINRMKYLDKLVQKKTEELSHEMEISNELLNKVIELERNKNNYFINLSHELRTPLNVIYTTEQLITEFNKTEDGIARDKLSQYMIVMRRNTKRLLSLINNLIDTTKIDHGKYKINLEKNDIVYVVEEATLSLKEYIESKGIELIIDPEIEEKIIMCDAYEIERCIVNLVSNAAKFTPDGGKIEVCIKEVENKVMISVEDNGIGIDPKYHNLIFDRFNQIVDANAEVKGGSGLGLTITKHIIDLHNGKIYVESELNKGCKFTIIL
ncbi:MAG: ligand-binding sensor domain-containing protein [Romboutsia sp.]|uniref:ligand-binding sensor domain-containing protein n=1 Tax=Romboutsia sp. TaxID=1965302 RepID=UPI003F338BF7